MPVRDAVALGIKLAGALETVHHAGLLHCDVRPRNVLVTEWSEPALSGFDEAVRIDDVPEALLLHAPSVTTAPEILQGAAPSPATDVYGLAATLIQAVDDFLAGPEAALDDGSVAAAAEIRRIRAAYPETVMRPVASVEGDFRDMRVVRAPNEPGREVLTWLKRAAYHLTDRASHDSGMVPAGDAHWWHVSTFRRAVVTDMSEQGLRVRTRDRARAVGLARHGARSLKRLVVEGPAVAARYRAAMGTLTSRENWARLYGGPPG